eukprot:scaffold2695_cov452-Prasinococcus_capsulatus_cf.AAC.3
MPVLVLDSCHEGSCDCDLLFDDPKGNSTSACNIRGLLKELEPYQESYAQQQITVTFSLYDRPWFTATNESTLESDGATIESELPALYVSLAEAPCHGLAPKSLGSDLFPRSKAWVVCGCRMVQSNWFGRIFYEGKRDRLPGQLREG